MAVIRAVQNSLLLAYVVLNRGPIAYVIFQYRLSIPDGNLNEQLSDEQNPESFRVENA